MIFCMLLWEVIWTSTRAECISVRFLNLAAQVKQSPVCLKSSLLGVKTPSAWSRSVPTEWEKHPFCARSRKVVPSVSNTEELQPALWPCPYMCCLNLLVRSLPVFGIPCLLWCFVLGYQCDQRREGVNFWRYCFQAQLKVMECNSFRNVHLWVYNKRVSVCVFSPLTLRSKVP